MSMFRLILIILFFISICGCTTYKYNGKTYHSAEALYEAQQNWNQIEISKIPSYVNPKYKSAKFYIPSRYDFIEKGTKNTNLGPEVHKNLGISKAVTFEFMYEALKKSNLFETLDLERGNHRTADIGEYDALILYYIIDTDTLKSRIFTVKNGYLPLYVNLEFETVYERMINWLSHIEKILGPELLLPTASSELFILSYPTDVGDTSSKYPTLSNSPSNSDTKNTFSVRYTCDDLSKSDAYILLAKGHDYLDRDGDGHPCEWDKKSYKKTKYKSRNSSSSNCHWVKAHRRKNGTYVSGYRRCK